MKEVVVEGDIEIVLEEASAAGLGGQAAYILAMGVAQAGMQLLNTASALGVQVPMGGAIPGVFGAAPAAPVEAAIKKIDQLVKARFEVKPKSFPNQIEEITLGATSSDGGSREYSVTIGGEKTMPFYNFQEAMPHRQVCTLDVFDIPIPLARTVRAMYEDVMESPAEWAKKNVHEYGADMVTVHMTSTHTMNPGYHSAKEAAKTLEDVLQAVKVPVVIGGSGDPNADPEVFEKCAEVAEGERCLIASANLNMDYERIANAAKKYGHVVLSWTQLDINAQKTLNRHLFKLVPRDSIVIDPTTAALGYGLDYAFTNMERIRLSGLNGDKDLSFPMSSGTTNAWGAREAWMKDSPLSEDSGWGPREYRGPLWEIITGSTLAVAGGDLFMMMHPGAVQTFRELTQTLFGIIEKDPVDISNWIAAEVV